MSGEHSVIIGGSHAAAQLAASLRQEGWTGHISLISADPVVPYHRPPLSKAYLAGDQHQEDLLIRPAEFYQKTEVDLLLGSKVTAVDRQRKVVTLHDGGEIPYTKLALTTGAKVRKLLVPGHELEGVFYLRDLQDVDRIRHFVGRGKRAVIIGGGYIGLETAASLRKIGMEVTVLEALPRVLQRVTAAQVSAFYTRVHREEGVNVVTEAFADSINGRGSVESITCDDGTELKADLVIIGIGVMPDTELAENAGLTTENGILVDEFARTSDPDIVAAGDCTSHFNPIYRRRIRLESVQNATDQAKVAARTLCGKLEPYKALPWFWSDQYDLKLQIAGLSQGYDQVVMRGDWLSGRSFAAFYFEDGKFIAVDAINRPKEFMLSRRLLTQGQSPDPARLGDESVAIQDLMKI